jgi:ribonuclease HI
MEFNQQSSHVIYCDGACSGNPGVGGWAFIHWFPDNTVVEGSGFNPSTTNNRMEMTAAIEAIRAIAAGESIIILTDSVYLIRGITQWIFGWQKRGWKNSEGADILNKDLWELLYKISRGKKIDWRYVRGHSGFAGNERVDQLAVAQSLKRPLAGYSGSYDDYRVAILPLPEKVSLPEMKKINGLSAKEKAASFYLSLVNGVLESHSTWDQCQARVKGVSQARFKKVTSEVEAAEVIKSWGVDPSRLALKR